MNTAWMRSPKGEVREVEGTAAALTPLMAAGWHQVPPPPEETPAAPAPQEKK